MRNKQVVLVFSLLIICAVFWVSPIIAQEFAPITLSNAGDLTLVKTIEDVGVVGRMAWSPDGTLLAITGSSVWIYEPATDELTMFADLNAGGIAFNPDGTLLAVGGSSRDPVIRLLDVASGNEVQSLAGHTDSITGVAFSPDGRLLASSAQEGDNTVRLWDLETGEPVEIIEVNSLNGIFSVAFSPDGKWLAFDAFQFDLGSGRTQAQVRIWNIETGSEQIVLGAGQSGQPNNVIFSSDGDLLLTDSIQSIRDNSAFIWNPVSGASIRTIQVSGGVFKSNASAISINADDTVLATGHWDGTIRFHNVQSGVAIAAIEGAHERWIYSVVFSPDSTLLASGGHDRTVKLWGTTQLTDSPETNTEINSEDSGTDSTGCAVAAPNTVNLRAGAGTTFSVSRTLSPGENANVIGQTTGRDGFIWWNLGEEQWVRADVVTETGNCESVPIVP